MRNLTVTQWIIIIASVNLLLAWPQLDLIVTNWFYQPGSGFIMRGQWWERLLYHSIGYVIAGVLLSLIAIWWLTCRRFHSSPFARAITRNWPGLTGRTLLLLLALLVTVPGLIVNQGLKEYCGRARPIETVQFGGMKRFTPAFIPSDQGGGSFSSGHAAAAFYLIAVAAALQATQRRWLILATFYAVAIALSRIASGSHFLSDVIVSGGLVWLGWRLLFYQSLTK